LNSTRSAQLKRKPCLTERGKLEKGMEAVVWSWLETVVVVVVVV